MRGFDLQREESQRWARRMGGLGKRAPSPHVRDDLDARARVDQYCDWQRLRRQQLLSLRRVPALPDCERRYRVTERFVSDGVGYLV